MPSYVFITILMWRDDACIVNVISTMDVGLDYNELFIPTTRPTISFGSQLMIDSLSWRPTINKRLEKCRKAKSIKLESTSSSLEILTALPITFRCEKRSYLGLQTLPELTRKSVLRACSISIAKLIKILDFYLYFIYPSSL